MIKYLSLLPITVILLMLILAATSALDGLMAFRMVRDCVQFGTPLLIVIGIIFLFRGKKENGAWFLGNGLLCIAILGGLMFKTRGYPMINDYTSDLENPPSYRMAVTLPENKDRSMSFPVENIPLIREAAPEPLYLITPLDQHTVFEKVKAMIEKNHWQLTGADLSQGYVEAVVTSALFKFQDDFMVQMKKQADNTLRVDFRSKSRVGKGDLGANLERIRKFKKDLEDSL